MSRSALHLRPTLLLLCLLTGALAAQDPADPWNLFQVGRQQQFVLALEEAVQLAVENNLDIAASTLDPEIQAATEDEVLAAFDPTYFARASHTDATYPTASTLDGAANLLRKTHNFSTGLRKPLMTGGLAELRWDLGRGKTNSSFATLNPSWTANLTASLTQPLLRGMGVRRNLSTWKQARNNTGIAVEAEQQRVAEVVVQVIRAYWDLVFALGEMEVKRLALRRAEKLLEENRERFRVGQIIEIEVIEAEVEVANGRRDLIISERLVKDAEETLKVLIRPLDPEFLRERELHPSTLPDPRTEDKELLPLVLAALQLSPSEGRTPTGEGNYLRVVQQALERRWDVRQSRLRLQNLQINVEDAESDLLWQLDLDTSFTINALDSHWDRATSNLDDGDFNTWAIGLTLEIPLGNRAARASLRRAELERRQALLEHYALLESVVLEIRSSLRSVITQYRQLTPAREARELAARQLEKEEARHSEGLSTSFKVLDFQEDLRVAESSELLARIDFEKSLGDLQLATGRVLEVYGVVQEEQAVPGEPRFGDLVR